MGADAQGGVDHSFIFVAAADQHGALSFAQLRRLGVSAKAQRAAVRAGWMEVAAPGVVVLTASPDTWFRRLHVGLLALGPAAWVSHEAAAALHGLDGARETVDLCMLRSGRPCEVPGAVVHTTRWVGPVDVITVRGFRCSTATRAVLELASASAPENRLAAAIDSSIRLRLSAPLVLEQRLAQFRGRGRTGVRILDRLLLDSGGESVLERRFLALVREEALPKPATQRRVRSEGRHVARVDFCWAGLGVVVEVSGRLGHSNPVDRGRDAQRRNELQDLGYRVYEYTWAHLTRRRSWVAETLRRRLDAAPDRSLTGAPSRT